MEVMDSTPRLNLENMISPGEREFFHRMGYSITDSLARLNMDILNTPVPLNGFWAGRPLAQDLLNSIIVRNTRRLQEEQEAQRRADLQAQIQLQEQQRQLAQQVFFARLAASRSPTLLGALGEAAGNQPIQQPASPIQTTCTRWAGGMNCTTR